MKRRLWQGKRRASEGAISLENISPDERRQKLIAVTEALPAILWSMGRLPTPILDRYDGPYSGWMVYQRWSGALWRMASFDHSDNHRAVFKERGDALYICDKTQGLSQAGTVYYDGIQHITWNDRRILHDGGGVGFWDSCDEVPAAEQAFTSAEIAQHIGHFINVYDIGEQVREKVGQVY